MFGKSGDKEKAALENNGGESSSALSKSMIDGGNHRYEHEEDHGFRVVDRLSRPIPRRVDSPDAMPSQSAKFMVPDSLKTGRHHDLTLAGTTGKPNPPGAASLGQKHLGKA